MFVIERFAAVAEIRDQGEIDSVIAALVAAGYQPALRSMVAAAKQVAKLTGPGVGVEALVNRDVRFRAGLRADAPIGDLLFTPTATVADRCYFAQPFNNQLFVFEIRHHCLPSGVIDFCAKVEQATRSHLDGRRVRGMNFNWRPVKEPTSRHVSAPSRLPDSELKTKKPEYSEEDLQAARLLIAAEPRGLLLQLAQVGKLRAADAKLAATLFDQMLAAGLIRKEYLVLCRKDSRTLCQVASTEDLNEVSGGKLVCATCGRKFSEEMLHEIFAGTDRGKHLITASRWMMIWLTDLLVQAGLTREAISWSATSGDDEIDIMTDELGLRIMFELKDREFGLGDAYPFAYRLERYQGNLGIVVSTDRVADEALKFFQEQRSKSAASIETLVGTRIEAGTRELIDRYSRTGVLRVLTALAQPFGINVAPLVSNWMESFAAAFRTGRYKPPAVPVAETALMVVAESGAA